MQIRFSFIFFIYTLKIDSKNNFSYYDIMKIYLDHYVYNRPFDVLETERFIRAEGFNTFCTLLRASFRVLKKGIKPRMQIPIKKSTTSPFRARLLISCPSIEQEPEPD